MLNVRNPDQRPAYASRLDALATLANSGRRPGRDPRSAEPQARLATRPALTNRSDDELQAAFDRGAAAYEAANGRPPDDR